MTRIRSVALAAATFIAACGGSEGPVDPPAPVVSKVVVTPAAPTLDQGATVQFIASAQDASGNPVSGSTVTWSSSNQSVATITASGLATGVTAGTSAITATVAGVAGSAVLTVTQSLCSSPKTVSLTAGQSASYASTDCIILPTGASGDRYRVVVLRPAETGNASDVVTATLKVVGIGVSGLVAPPAPAAVDAGFVGDIPGLSPEAVRRAIRVSEATERFHRTLRAQDDVLLREVGLKNLAWARARRERFSALSAAPTLATSPDKITLDTSTAGDCTTTPSAKKTAVKIHETDDLVFYQDSTQNATNALTVGQATRMSDYYAAHSKAMIQGYFGKPSDIDGNGKVLVFVTPIVQEDVAAFVWSGDFFDNDPANPNGCPASNEAEIIYFNLSLIQAMTATSPAYQALETLAHEMKHVVSINNRIAASLRVGTSQYHPSWIEEGTAEIAGEMSSRIAWASIGGPAVGAQVTRTSFVNTTGNIVPENYGIAIKLARTAWYLSSQPNAVIVEPTGAQEGASIYGSGWLFHRWLGDAYAAAASAPQKDSTLFRALNDSLAPRGVTGIAQQTGKPFLTLLDEFIATMSLHKTTTAAVSRDFTTYDFVTAAEIFCTPNPLGVFPWPVTTTGTPGDCNANPRVNESSAPSASFKTAQYSGPMGITGVRIHDFVSNGTGTGAQVTVDVGAPAKMIVVRVR